MKWLIVILIRSYWVLIPAENRRSCLFSKSCSHHVYETTIHKGFRAGVQAFWKRFSQCRDGYRLIINQLGQFELHLVDGTILPQDEISSQILLPFFELLKLEEVILSVLEVPDEKVGNS